MCCFSDFLLGVFPCPTGQELRDRALLAAVYIAAGRNVLPAIAAHTLINPVIEPWLLLPAVSGDWAGTRKRSAS